MHRVRHRSEPAWMKPLMFKKNIRFTPRTASTVGLLSIFRWYEPQTHFSAGDQVFFEKKKREASFKTDLIIDHVAFMLRPSINIREVWPLCNRKHRFVCIKMWWIQELYLVSVRIISNNKAKSLQCNLQVTLQFSLLYKGAAHRPNANSRATSDSVAWLR